MSQPQIMQVRTSLRGDRLDEFNLLADHLGLSSSAVLKLAVRRLAQSELPQNQTASPVSSKEAA